MPIIFVKLLIFVSFVFFCIFAFLPKRYLSLYYISRLTIPAFVFSYIWFVFFLFSYRLHTSYFPIVSTEWIRIVPDHPFLRVRIWTSYCKCSKGLPPAELDIDLPSPLMKIPSLFVLPQCPLTPHPLHPVYFFNFLQLGKQLCWLGPQHISNFKMLTSKSEWGAEKCLRARHFFFHYLSSSFLRAIE